MATSSPHHSSPTSTSSKLISTTHRLESFVSPFTFCHRRNRRPDNGHSSLVPWTLNGYTSLSSRPGFIPSLRQFEFSIHSQFGSTFLFWFFLTEFHGTWWSAIHIDKSASTVWEESTATSSSHSTPESSARHCSSSPEWTHLPQARISISDGSTFV